MQLSWDIWVLGFCQREAETKQPSELWCASTPFHDRHGTRLLYHKMLPPETAAKNLLPPAWDNPSQSRAPFSSERTFLWWKAMQHCVGKPLKSSTNKYRYDCTSNKGKRSTDGSGQVLHTAVLCLLGRREASGTRALAHFVYTWGSRKTLWL